MGLGSPKIDKVLNTRKRGLFIAGECMKKNILLICNYFAPDNTIAAVRTSKLAKYLRQSGYEVQVIAEKKDTAAEDEILKKGHRKYKGILCISI